MCRTLYITDLDETLLGRDQTVSSFTAGAINALVGNGMTFSYATARSKITASKVTKNILAKIPIIVYNGAFIVDYPAGELLYASYFEERDREEILETLLRHGIFPIVYSNADGMERFSYLFRQMNAETRDFLCTREKDPRDTPVSKADELSLAGTFYFTCIDQAENLAPLYDKWKDRFSCVYDTDIYSGKQWLEIMPPDVNKAASALRLKKMLGCDKIISFGDGKNDISLFRISDECYAVENADIELKQYATDIIAGNNEDGVAKWLLENTSF